jgi:hypothetical protein
MKWANGDRLLGLTSKTGEPVHGIEESLAAKNRVNSELYFVKSQRHVIDTTDTERLAAEVITVIYLSFTNVRVSIALPGSGVSLVGGTNGTYSGK